MGTIIENLYDHEGYGARRLPDDTLTGGWSTDTSVFAAYVSACGCGWQGGEHPPTEQGYAAAVDEWERDHARPLLAETVPATVSDAIKDAKQAIAALSKQRPGAARRAVDELEQWTKVMHDRLETEPVAARMRRGLDALGQLDRGRKFRR